MTSTGCGAAGTVRPDEWRRSAPDVACTTGAAEGRRYRVDGARSREGCARAGAVVRRVSAASDGEPGPAV